MGSAVFFVNSDCGMHISSFWWLVRMYSKKGTQRKCFAKNWEAHKVERNSRQGCESGVNTWIFFLHRVRHEICPIFYTTGFSNQHFYTVICNIVRSLQNSANAFSISYFVILDINVLDYKTDFWRKQTQINDWSWNVCAQYARDCVVSGEIYTADKNFTLTPVVTLMTNFTLASGVTNVWYSLTINMNCCIALYREWLPGHSYMGAKNVPMAEKRT